ncbi:hypothetical protein [Halocalculus aciditolerans]|nr:hypothetical protein [Halocalculus aciditolerans]
MAEEILYPAGEEQTECAICGGPLYIPLSSPYANLVCDECDRRAVTEDGEEPTHGKAYREKMAEKYGPESAQARSGSGDNPVFIDGQKCWRRYRHGGYVTRLDQFDCDDIWEFRETHNQ